MVPYSKGLVPRAYARGAAHKTTIRGAEPLDFKFELFPLHSQLLGESWLVSFPPLSYMLKFSG